MASAINEHPGCDVIYSDEDKLDMDGGALFDPHFKPDFNPDLLTSDTKLWEYDKSPLLPPCTGK